MHRAALADAAAGVVSLALRGAVEIACDPVGRFVYDDEGVSDQYQGLLTVEGVTYRCRFVIFTNGGGMWKRSGALKRCGGMCGSSWKKRGNDRQGAAITGPQTAQPTGPKGAWSCRY